MAEPTDSKIVVPIGTAVAGALKEGPLTGEDQAHLASEQASTTPALEDSNPLREVHSHTAAPRIAPSVQDVKVGYHDGRGVTVTRIYEYQPKQYAIYQAGEVTVHFADDNDTRIIQRNCIFPLSAARAELNSLILGLPRREVFDQKLAYALHLALNGTLDGAKATLAEAIDSALTQRQAAGRFQYLAWSYTVAAIMLGLLFLLSRYYRFDNPSSNLWLAGKAGLVGAAFSIALAVRGRAAVALDIDPRTNIMDGTLRLVIGVISAGVLLLLLGSGVIPTIKIGDANFSGSGLTWQLVIVIGFVAGFLERLVPDLLERQNVQGKGANSGTGSGRDAGETVNPPRPSSSAAK
jgi:hypothetical protein